MGNISQLPDELWLMILEHGRDEPAAFRLTHQGVRNRCERLVVLGNLSMTCRRLRRLVCPMLDEAMDTLYTNDEAKENAEPVSQNDWYRSPLEAWLHVEFLHAIRQCPILVQHVRALPPVLTELNQYNWTWIVAVRGNELRPFGQKVLRSLGLTEDIGEWNSRQGWIALLLLMLPKLESITWTGEGSVDIASPLRRMVDIAKKQNPPKSFRSLKTVALDCRLPIIPDALKWDFLVLPSVEAIQGLECRPLADRLHISPDFRRVSITTFRSGGQPLPMHLLEEKFRLMPNVCSFQYRFSLHHNGGFIQMMALTHTLRKLSQSLQEVSIEPLTSTSSSIRRSRGRTSPHMWKRVSEEQPIGNLGDAGWLLGSLTSFERLRVVRAPHTALYDPRYVVALKHLLPRSLRHLDVSPEPTPHKLDAALFATQLVAMVRSKPERYPHFSKLILGNHTTLCTPLLKDICAKFGVEVYTDARAPKVAPPVEESMEMTPVMAKDNASVAIAKCKENTAKTNTQVDLTAEKVQAGVTVVAVHNEAGDVAVT